MHVWEDVGGAWSGEGCVCLLGRGTGSASVSVLDGRRGEGYSRLSIMHLTLPTIDNLHVLIVSMPY